MNVGTWKVLGFQDGSDCAQPFLSH
eukprot:SAG31_NODE_40994_length_278_cov_0.581006_1_plen_24_part_10